MKRKLVKYYFVFVLLIPELKILAQLEHNYRSNGNGIKESELFPNKFIFSRHKYVFNKKRLKQNATCLILKEKNDKEINLLLQDAKKFRKTSNIAYFIGIPTATAGIYFISSGISYIWEHTHYYWTGGNYISNEDSKYGKKLENIGLGFSAVSVTSLLIATTYYIKDRKRVRSAVKIYNQKY